MTIDIEKLRNAALEAAEQWAERAHMDAKNRGAGGPGCEADVDRLCDKTHDAINALARASAPPVILPVPTDWVLRTGHGTFYRQTPPTPDMPFADKWIALAAAPALQEGSEQPPEHQQEGQPAALRAAPAGQLDANERDAVHWRELLEAVMREFPRNMGRSNGGNAPGHCHAIPGIWDSDNGAKAGTQCAWCLVWNEAKKAIEQRPAAPVEQITSTDTNNEKGQA